MLVVTACSGTTTVLEGRVTPLDEAWRAELPGEAYGFWDVHATPDCILAVGTPGDDFMKEREPERRVLCLSPQTGELRWDVRLGAPPGAAGDRWHPTDDLLTYVSRDAITALSTDDGSIRWTFDPGGRTIRETVFDREQIIANLDGEVLVVLDAEDGAWVRGIQIFRSRLIGARNGLAIVAVEPSESGSWTRPALMAVDLDVEGGEEPRPPFPAATFAWRTNVSRTQSDLWMADGVVIGNLGDAKLWGVSLMDGTVLYQERLRAPPTTAVRRNNRRRARTPTTGNTPPPEVTEADLLSSWQLGRGQRPFLAADSLLLTQGRHKGFAARVVRIDAHDTETMERVWSQTIVGNEAIVLARNLPEAGLVVLARRSDVSILDRDSGRVVWQGPIDDSDELPWVRMDCDGRGIYRVAADEEGTVLIVAQPLR